MLSVIVCSVNPQNLQKLKENIKKTIGPDVAYELIAIDNRNGAEPIAKVYNRLAGQARYPYLLFIHEDAGFITHDWYDIIASRLRNQECGVIGFAGSKVVYDVPGGWFMEPSQIVVYMNQSGQDVKVNAGADKPWNEVATVDGYAMFVRREVWEEMPFDEHLLTGFHCYDMDFSLTVGTKYKNYVCGEVMTYHDSKGNYDAKWIEQTMKIYTSKWSGRMLPAMSSDAVIDAENMEELSERAYFRMLKRVAENGPIPDSMMQGFKSYKLTLRNLEHRIKLLFMRKRKI